MRRPELELLEDDLDDPRPFVTSDLGIPIDLAREDLEEDDGGDCLGLRSLYSNPEIAIDPRGWPHAA